MNNIIVRCLGGLGNQMFQYAFYRRLQLENKNVFLDISGFKDYSLHYGFELNRVFKINVDEPDYSLVDEIKKCSMSRGFWHRVCRKLKLYNQYITQKSFNYDPKYVSFTNSQTVYLDGYWQSEKYFGEAVNIIRNDFKFLDIDAYNSFYAANIKKCNSVSLHVRMGDYVDHPIHGGICTIEYYQRAVDFIKSKLDNPIFFVFSNDVEWCKQNLNIVDGIYVIGNVNENSYRDMQLMSLCKHNIIANSSFSWWGAWLNSNPDKIIVSPSKWFNDENINTRDILPESWIKI